MIEVYENDNRMIDLSKLPKEKPDSVQIREEEIRRKAQNLKNSIIAKKKAAS